MISKTFFAEAVGIGEFGRGVIEFFREIPGLILVFILATLLIALFGGWIWKTLGIEILFMISAFLGLYNSAYEATIKTKKTES